MRNGKAQNSHSSFFSLRSATGLGIGEFHDLNDIVDWVHSMEMDVIQVSSNK